MSLLRLSPAAGLLVLVCLLAAAGVVGYHKAYHKGYQAHATKAKADLADHLGRAIEQANQVAAQDREIMLAGDARLARVRTEFRTIDREVTVYVRENPDAVPCLDARGLCLWRAINAGHIEAAACDNVDDGQVPGGAVAADLGQGPGPAGGSQTPGGAVPRAAGGGGDVGRVDAGKPPYWGWR